jgi:S-adenosylmethionine/arginine decarboxylase-like enzyme
MFLVSRYLYTLDKTCVNKKTDQTLEIIMVDLDPEKMKIFYQDRLLVSHRFLDKNKNEFLRNRYLYTLDKSCVRTKTDQTLEVIMTDLDPEIMKIFYQEYTSSAAEATKVYFHFKSSILS